MLFCVVFCINLKSGCSKEEGVQCHKDALFGDEGRKLWFSASIFFVIVGTVHKLVWEYAVHRLP